MSNEPVAWMDEETGCFVYNQYEYEDLDEHGKDGLIPLYTHPVKEQYKFGVDWSKDGNAVTVLKICEDGVAEVVFMDYQEATHPVKEQLTDEEITACMGFLPKYNSEIVDEDLVNFARAILRKAQENGNV